jgi:hypothetical protein
VNCNGTGTFSRDLIANGITAHLVDDFIITGAVRTSLGVMLATTIVDAQQSPSAIVAGGIFVTRTHTLLPN